MDRGEKTQYLANIYKLCFADKSLDDQEERAIELVCTELGLHSHDRREARRLYEDGGFEVALPSRLSDRIKNLEDLLFVASANESIETVESRVLTEVANLVPVDKDTLGVIVTEAKERYRHFVEGDDAEGSFSL